MSAVVVFTGPTLSAGQARLELDAEYRPPAAEGDVYRAARRGPAVIGLIDGYFERVPAVWHKEILWAMSQGIHVFGAASMGALRAAELEAFGMEGVGAIFEAFRDGALEDDDEVAVAHAGREFDFRQGSEAMVDIRYTLGLACDAGVIGAATSTAMETAAKAMFYPARRYEALVGRAREAGASIAELDAFQEWLPRGRASLKRADAVAMLRLIRERLDGGLEPKRVQYAFENSSMWESAWRLAGEADGSEPVIPDELLDELRLEGDLFQRTQQAAMLRALAIKHSYVQGMGEAGGQTALSTQWFWRHQGVHSDEARRDWMQANNLDEVGLSRLLDDEARAGWISSLATFNAKGYVLDQLRVSGDYSRLVERARTKMRALESRGLEDATPSDAGLDGNGLLEWYFEARLGRAVPVDIDQYCRDLGLAGRAALERVLAREFCYVEAESVKAGTEG